MKKKITVSSIIIILLAAAALACFFVFGGKKEPSEAMPPIRYVQGIITDTDSPEHRLVSGFNAADASKAFFLLGTKNRCDEFSLIFAGCDSFDNVDGSARPDGLSDFAGESFCSLAGFDNVDSLSALGNEETLRELTVRSVLAAMDTVCYVSPYDRTGMGKKPLPKMIVLVSPYMSVHGKYDVDSLFSALGCKLPLISPVSLAADAVIAGKAQKTKLTVGVLMKEASADSAAYCRIIAEKASASGLDSALCIPFRVQKDEDALTAFLDSYSALGRTAPIDAIVIDDTELNSGELQESLQRVTSVMNVESMTYGNLLAKDFRFVDTGRLVSTTVFSMLRRHNLFTHRISQPALYDYMLIPREGNMAERMVLPYNERFIPRDN